jgi:outer membrane protein assembly factor BamB
MTNQTSLERSIAAWMADEAAGSGSDALFDDILAATRGVKPERRWQALLKEPPMRFHSRVAVGSPTARVLLVTVIPLLLVLASVAVVLAVQPAGETDDWPIFLGDYDRTGVAEQGPVGLPVVKWQFHAGGSTTRNVAIVGELVYASSDDGLLHALSRADGTERWTYPAAGSDVSVAEGTVLIADATGTFHALDAETGVERWDAEPLTVPTGATYGDGRFYVGTETGELVALDLATGAVDWRTTISPTAVRNPAFADGRVLAAADGAYLAVNAGTGDVLWTADLDGEATGSARTGEGIAFIGAGGDALTGHVRAIDLESGRELWNKEGLIYGPAIADGIGISGGPGLVIAYDIRTGAERWRATFDGIVRGGAIADGVVYLPADGERRTYALDASTGKELWRFELDGTVSGIAVAGGVVYSATDAGTIWAIGGDGSDITPGPVPSVDATTAPSPQPSLPTASSTATGLAAEFLWEAAGPEEPFIPTTMALAPDGNLWVTDPFNDRFAIFSPDGEFIEYWGRSGSDDGEFEFQRFNGDWYGGVGFAPDGSFFTLDAGNRRVQHFDKDRTFLAKWGSFGKDPGQFNLPTAIAVAPDGSVHVLDEGRGVIEQYDAQGTVLGSRNPFQEHREGFNMAGAFTIDRHGNAYVSMYQPNQIVRLDALGEITLVYASDRLVEAPGYPSVDAEGRLFVSQGPRRGGQPGVLVFGRDGTYLGGWAYEGDGEGELGFPTGVLVDEAGDVYVGDAAGSPEFPGRPRVQKFHVDFAP